MDHLSLRIDERTFGTARFCLVLLAAVLAACPGTRRRGDDDDDDTVVDDDDSAADDDDSTGDDDDATGDDDDATGDDDDATGDDDDSTPQDDDGDGVPASLDCDDADPANFPGNPEVCDGQDNDCDAATLEGVRFTASGGGVTELTTTFSAGTASTPYEWASGADGVLEVCAGTWFARITVGSDLQIIAPEGPNLTELNGGHTGPVIDIDGSFDVAIEGLSVVDGEATLEGELSWLLGGGLQCTDAVLSIANSIFSSNHADVGGALCSTDCNVTITGTTFDDNSADDRGGAVAVRGGSVEITDSLFTNNTSATHGGALSPYSWTSAVILDLVDTLLSGNTSGQLGGGIYLLAPPETSLPVTVTCTATTPGAGGFVGNVAGSFGGAGRLYGTGAQLVSAGCDWGTGANDNTPNDLRVGSNTYDYGNPASFTCTGPMTCN